MAEGAAARWAMVQAESFSGRAASPRGRRWTGLVTPSCPFLSTLGPEGTPHPARGLGAAQGRRGWPGEPGRVTGGCLPRSPSPGEPVPWEKAARRQKQLSLPVLGPQGCCQPVSLCQGSLEATWARPRLQVPGLSGGVPRGTLHLQGDRVGRAASCLPRLGPVPQGPLEDHPQRLPQALRLVPARQEVDHGLGAAVDAEAQVGDVLGEGRRDPEDPEEEPVDAQVDGGHEEHRDHGQDDVVELGRALAPPGPALHVQDEG